MLKKLHLSMKRTILREVFKLTLLIYIHHTSTGPGLSYLIESRKTNSVTFNLKCLISHGHNTMKEFILDLPFG